MQQIADKMNFQDPVQKYAECHSWDMSNSNATKYHEIKVGILDNTCFKENVPTFEILVGWILRLGLNFGVINVALYGWKCDPAYVRPIFKPYCWSPKKCQVQGMMGWLRENKMYLIGAYLPEPSHHPLRTVFWAISNIGLYAWPCLLMCAQNGIIIKHLYLRQLSMCPTNAYHYSCLVFYSMLWAH